MPNIQTTTHNPNRGRVELLDGRFRDDLLIFAGAATVLKGTLLARLSATGKLTPFVVGGSLGAEVPEAVLTVDVTRAAAGDESIRVLVAGEVNRNRLIIHADGNGNNITGDMLEQLRSHNIVAVDAQQLSASALA